MSTVLPRSCAVSRCCQYVRNPSAELNLVNVLIPCVETACFIVQEHKMVSASSNSVRDIKCF